MSAAPFLLCVPVQVPPGLVRGQLPAVVFVQKVRAEGCGVRSGPMSPSLLWSLVESDAVRPSLRVGAAIALARADLLDRSRFADVLEDAPSALALALETAVGGMEAFLVADALDRAERAWRRRSR